MKKAAALVLLSGCATLFGGGPDEVTIMSHPPGATIMVNGNPAGATPAVLAFDRDSSAYVELSLAGYRTAKFELQKTFNTWTLLNLTDPIGWIIDFATGNWQSYQDGIDMGLAPLGES